jgi:PKD repeat protein
MNSFLKGTLCTLILSLYAPAAEWQVIGWNDLGMHCMDGTDFSVFSILPPYNTIHAHVLHNGEPVSSTNGLSVTYEAIADPDGSINTTSADKINFWEHVADMFGAQPADDTGLAGAEMPGASNTPQPMHFESAHNWFTGEGIPISPFDDAGSVNYYPMMKIVVRYNGAEVASTRIVLPVSDEMTCSACHQSGSGPAAEPAAGWRWHPDPDKDVKLNTLRLHDEKQLSNPAIFQALENQGFNTNGLYQTVVADGTAILCARCHQSNALPVTSDPYATNTMTQAMHSHHGAVTDPASGMILNDSNNRDSCYRCHPGSDTQCLRGAMGAAVAADGSLAIECQSCHGTMSTVGAATRSGWFDEPKCQSCHPGVNGSDPIRYVTVFETGGTERIPANTTFAHPTNTLYRFSEGHGNLQCSTCHGSPHAIYPSAHGNDNLQNEDMQGHEGTAVECLNCHASVPYTFSDGPHGMHPVGNTDFSEKGSNENRFHGKAKEDNNLGSLDSCMNCHGTDYKGTVLSQAHDLRVIDADGMGTKTFWRGYRIGCYSCHNGPNNDNNNPNPAPVISSASAATAANVPVAIPLTANEGTLRIVSQPHSGTVGLSGSTATYTPFLNFTGTDAFTFAAWDGEKDSNLATGTVTVVNGTCVLSCETVVPASGPSRSELPFWANGFVSNCVTGISYLWSFGDGGSSTAALAQHAYATNGAYGWQVIASAAGLSVTNSGTVTVSNVRLDSDDDGIEDDWEWQIFQTLETADRSSDADGDGQSDRAEYLAGTDPQDAGSRLQINSIANGQILWSSAPNRSYTVQSTTSLVHAAFAPLATGQAATPPENGFTDPIAARQKFYRIRLD